MEHTELITRRFKRSGMIATTLGWIFLFTTNAVLGQDAEVVSQLATQSKPGKEAQTVLGVVKLDHPRDTMRTFMSAMNEYAIGVSTGDKEKLQSIDTAVRTLNLDEIPRVVRQEKGKEAAQLLKEVIDRVILIDYSKIPVESDDPNKPLLRWRLKGTEIAIARVESGDRAGEYLFTKDTVDRSKEFYAKVKSMPYLDGSGKGAGYSEPWLEKNVPAWARQKIILFPNWQWIGLLVSIFLGLMIKVIGQWSLGVVESLSAKHTNRWIHRSVEALERPFGLLLAALFWYSSVHLLRFEGIPLVLLTWVIQIVLSVSIIWSFYRLADVLAEYLSVWTQKTDTLLDDHLVPLVRKSLKIFIVIFGVLVVCQNLGFNVASVFAGLGLGGLAFALAAKDTAANLFGSIMIIVDRPFQIGDWVIADGVEGTVKEIGFRSTRLRTFYDSMISVPNATMANAKIDNMGRRRYRRIKAVLGVAYDTPSEKMEAFLEGIKKVIQANEHTRKDYFHVVFDSYGDFSLNVLVYCFLEVPTWSDELVERQNLYLEIYRLAEKLGVEFAFPTQTLHVESTPDQKKPVANFDRNDLEQTANSFGSGGNESRPSGSGIFTAPHREKGS